MCGDLCDLYFAGMEYGVQPVSIHAQCAGELQEAAHIFRLSSWQRFWRLELPFAMPGLLWNMMMSMSGGWFFLVAAEAISVAGQDIKLPGIGSYIAVAIEAKMAMPLLWAIAAMLERHTCRTTNCFSALCWRGQTSFVLKNRKAIPRNNPGCWTGCATAAGCAPGLSNSGL